MLKRDWFAEGFKNRFPILALVLAYSLVYFPINRYLMDKGGWVADIELIDGNMPLIPIFVVPYIIGLLMIGIFPLWATFKLPRDLYQEYIVALLVVMTMGFSLWLLVPAYVIKEPITETGFFADLLRGFHTGDDTTGVHNAIPSSHVYYVTIATLFFIQWRRRLIVPLLIFAVLNALSTMFTHQHYILDVLAGFGVTALAYGITNVWLIPYIRREEVRHGIRKLHLLKE